MVLEMVEVNSPSGAAPITEDGRRAILERAGVWARDPSAFPGLSLQMNPKEGLDPSFRPVGYDTRDTTGEMVHCSICAQQQEHFDGAIVRLLDGSIGLVGNDCGKRHFFGEDGWAAISSRIRQDSDSALFLARFGRAKERLSEVDRVLADWASALGAVDTVRAQFSARLPKLFGKISRDGRNGALQISEEIAVPFRLRDGSIEMRTETRLRDFCRIGAQTFFTPFRWAEAVDAARRSLVTAGGYLRADATSHNVTAVRRMMRDSRRTLEDVAARQSELAPLQSSKMLANLADWANRVMTGGAVYSAEGLILRMVSPGHPEAAVDLGGLPSGSDSHFQHVAALWPSL